MLAIVSQPTGMGAIDYVIIAAYLLAMIGIGVWFSRGQETEEEFLMGGRQMHWFLVTLAAVATAFSGISLIGAPGYAFTNDIRFAMAMPATLITLPIVLLILPVLVRLRVTTVYEYLEQRFSVSLRLIASALFLGSKFLFIATVIYTPALLLSTSIEIKIIPAVILMGVIATLLTMLGGMKAVMWSDAVQYVIMMLGIGVILMVLMLPDASGTGGLTDYLKIAHEAGRTRLTDWSLNLTELTTWSIIICMALAGVSTTFSDQVMMQRYFAAGSSRAVAKSFVASTIIAFPTVAVLYLLGLLLFGFYNSGVHGMPDDIRSNGDKVLPFFVSTQLPVGMKGLVIAAIMAATLSTVSSILNSLVTAIMTDFYRKFRKDVPPSDYNANEGNAAVTTGRMSEVTLSRILTIVVGLLGTFVACYVHKLGMIIEQTQTLFGLIGGGLGGIFFLGLFTRRANSGGTTIGAIVGTLATAAVMWGPSLGWWSLQIHFMWYYVVGMGVTVIVGYVLSLFLPDTFWANKPVEKKRGFPLDERPA